MHIQDVGGPHLKRHQLRTSTSFGDTKTCLMCRLLLRWQRCERRFTDIPAVVASSDEFTRHQINACRSVVQNRRMLRR